MELVAKTEGTSLNRFDTARLSGRHTDGRTRRTDLWNVVKCTALCIATRGKKCRRNLLLYHCNVNGVLVRLIVRQVELSVAKGLAELKITVRCERIVPVRGEVADLFKKTSVIVTRVIEVVCLLFITIDLTVRRGVYPPKDEDADFPPVWSGGWSTPHPQITRTSRLPRPSPMFWFGT